MPDRVCFVTGGASGIGAQCARQFARQGELVVIADINERLGQAVVSEIHKEFGQGRAIFVLCNVMKGGAIRSALEEAINAYGRLDVAIK
ncbi:hypothetical protein IEQ34_025139 [Dendrobium chrysotoxum]|uniref:SDR family NAD(P)-dependent oxidoreductase n=1 Tax=Dendrobium chrysotoxum TaxID=161865 RepID=A0AAV7FJ54_DENCH|nr:hypothetical protein IEQ34_025139 [Dendrobium chrysotoxum]